jgi:O-antigen ligase
MAVGIWPDWVVWLNLAVAAVFLVLADSFDGLLFLIISIPFYVAVPNPKFDSLSSWRILFAVFFLKWFAEEIIVKKQKIVFFYWDKILGLFTLLAFMVTLAFAQFRLPGFKQIIFWLNIYVVYLAAANLIKNRQQVIKLAKFLASSASMIIGLGFVQLLVTFFTNLDTFWVYWASFVSKLYYGDYFSSITLYSNSWFSYNGIRELRMFSIMPDSQSFAYVCVFAVGLGTALTFTISKKARAWLWSGIRSAGLALVLSGTRAVWVGMVAPFMALAIALKTNFIKAPAKKFFWPFIMIIILFAISPLINKGLDYLRAGGRFKENFIERAKSIYDLSEISNAGRIAIWKDSLVFAARHPLGIGVGNFMVSLGQSDLKSYQEASTKLNERYNLPQRYVSAHSLYLQILVETGVLGLFLLIWFFVQILSDIWSFLSLYRQSEDFLVIFVLQFSLLLLWILFAGFFDITLFNDKVLMFFLLSLAIVKAIIKLSQDQSRQG